MPLTILLLLSYINASPFENSQRIKGLGNKFSRIVEDTVTDLVYEPGLSALLDAPIIIADFCYGSSSVYRAGGFMPSLVGNLAASIFFEASAEPYYYTNEEDNEYWGHGIVNVAHPLADRQTVLSLGTDVSIRKYLSNREKSSIESYKILLAYILNREKISTRVNLDYIQGISKNHTLTSNFYHRQYISQYNLGDTITYIEDYSEHGFENYSDTSRYRTDTLRLSIISSLPQPGKGKTIIFASLKKGLSEDYKKDYSYNSDYSYFVERTRIRQDSCDTVISITSGEGTCKSAANTHYNNSLDDWDINIGIAQEQNLDEKFTGFYGLRMNYRYRDGFMETISMPLAFEYRASFFRLRLGLTLNAYNSNQTYDDYDNISFSNYYTFGFGLKAGKGVSLDFSNSVYLTNLEYWQIGITKKF